MAQNYSKYCIHVVTEKTFLIHFYQQHNKKLFTRNICSGRVANYVKAADAIDLFQIYCRHHVSFEKNIL